MLRSTAQPQRLLSTIRPQTSRTSLLPSYIPINRRLASTATGPKRSSWRSFFVRLGLAGGVIYYYNTADIFQPQPVFKPSGPEQKTTPPPTLESIAAERQQKRAAATPKASKAPPLGSETPAVSAESLEAEADQQGAFNPETGEINWDCPCLGGMAHGPCGEEFKAAFSCFVFSEVEPKGMDCVDKFKGMQDCFRAHPDVYAAELEDDEDDGEMTGALAEDEATRPVEGGEAPSVAAKIQEDAVNAAEATKEKTKQVVADVKEQAASTVDEAKRALVHAEDKAIEKTTGPKV